MREILFRGKRIDNGEWITGGIFQQKADDVKDEVVYIIDNSSNDVDWAHRVIPETVGQFTGVTDKKGNRVFEGREECNNKKHYYVNTIDLVIEDENTVLFDQNRYDVGNYYSDKTIAENNARADRLLRCLRQWQAQNDEVISKEDWEDQDLKKYSIIYDYSSNVFYAGRTWWMREPNNIYFKSREKAEEAIELFKDELLWYFTEYVQRLDEVQNG